MAWKVLALDVDADAAIALATNISGRVWMHMPALRVPLDPTMERPGRNHHLANGVAGAHRMPPHRSPSCRHVEQQMWRTATYGVVAGHDTAII